MPLHCEEEQERQQTPVEPHRHSTIGPRLLIIID